jgi:hypothetical protein
MRSVTENLDKLRGLPARGGWFVRAILFCYVLLVACPIRYWPLESGTDPTWRFALNYAHAAGIETVFTSGPLGYLIFPQHIGNNLVQALAFQAGLWLVLAALFADIFFRAGFRVRNLALFSFSFCLAAPVFWYNAFGLDNLMLAGALLLIVTFHFRGSWPRYVAALALIGLLPLFTPAAAVTGVAALAGFLVERAMRTGRRVIPLAALKAVALAAMAAGGFLCLLPSVAAILRSWRSSVEIVAGYTGAMSKVGSIWEFALALEVTAMVSALLWVYAHRSFREARFYAFFLAIPLWLSFKHGFVRQDAHTIYFFCFVALCLALVSLTIDLGRNNAVRVLPLVLLISFILAYRFGKPETILQATGVQAARNVWGALHYDRLKQQLDASITGFPERDRIEPELLNQIGDSPVASLSKSYTNLAAARTSLTVYPVVQRYSAYTPYLDGLNAAWIRDKGPRFLVFDGSAIDGRDAWAETPAMWLEIYRWYDTRLLGTNNLLLERRARVRFSSLETIRRFSLAFPCDLRLPASREDVFWTAHCSYSTTGQILKLLLRAPSVFISIRQQSGAARTARVVPDVLVSPVMGNYLPGDLAQYAELFREGGDRGYSVSRIQFADFGTAAFAPVCEVELLRPAP